MASSFSSSSPCLAPPRLPRANSELCAVESVLADLHPSMHAADLDLPRDLPARLANANRRAALAALDLDGLRARLFDARDADPFLADARRSLCQLLWCVLHPEEAASLGLEGGSPSFRLVFRLQYLLGQDAAKPADLHDATRAIVTPIVDKVMSYYGGARGLPISPRCPMDRPPFEVRLAVEWPGTGIDGYEDTIEPPLPGCMWATVGRSGCDGRLPQRIRFMGRCHFIVLQMNDGAYCVLDAWSPSGTLVDVPPRQHITSYLHPVPVVCANHSTAWVRVPGNEGTCFRLRLDFGRGSAATTAAGAMDRSGPPRSIPEDEHRTPR